VSARFLGIGLLSLGGLAVGATGGYLALKSDAPETTAVVSAPAPAPVKGTTTPEPIAAPPINPPQAEPVAADTSKPVSKSPASPARTKPDTGIESRSKPRPSASAHTSETATAPGAAQGATQPVSTPAVEPPATTSTAAATTPEVPRYTPEPAVSTPVAASEARQSDFEELTVTRHSVIGIRLDGPVSTRTARVEDRVTATVSRDVTVAGRTAIAAGVRLEGSVVAVERGGRFKNRPRIGLQFDRVILADGTRVNLKTDTIFREGDSPTADATAKVGTGAVAGAILGGLIGGKKGAVIGSTVGAAGGVATVMRGDGNEASLPAGAPLTVRLTEDVAIPIKR
jgi:hypothetical protein